jgi:hypothetical protein
MECIDSTLFFTQWENGGGGYRWLSPGTLCIFLEERLDMEDDVGDTIYWKVVVQDGAVGWTHVRLFNIIFP